MKNPPRITRWTATAAFLVLIVPVVSEFFIEWAREKGVYKEPSARVEAVVEALASLTYEWWFLVALGTFMGATVALWLVHWTKGDGPPPMPAVPVQFFPDRPGLVKHRTLTDQLKLADSIDVCWVTGAKALNEARELRRINRMILPNPKSQSLQSYKNTLPDKTLIDELIITNTRVAKSLGISVKWYPEFIGYSFMLGDSSKSMGWAQIELAMPFSNNENHSFILIQKTEQEEAFLRLVKIFDDLWQESEDPKI